MIWQRSTRLTQNLIWESEPLEIVARCENPPWAAISRPLLPAKRSESDCKCGLSSDRYRYNFPDGKFRLYIEKIMLQWPGGDEKRADQDVKGPRSVLSKLCGSKLSISVLSTSAEGADVNWPMIWDCPKLRSRFGFKIDAPKIKGSRKLTWISITGQSYFKYCIYFGHCASFYNVTTKLCNFTSRVLLIKNIFIFLYSSCFFI